MRSFAQFLVLLTLPVLGCGGNVTESNQGNNEDPNSCKAPGECVLTVNGCCAWCGQTKLSEVESLSRDAAEKCLSTSVCTDCSTPLPVPATPPAAYSAFCVNQKCETVDIRAHALSSCVQDTDCVLRYTGCCERCDGEFPSQLIALNKSQTKQYETEVCSASEHCTSCSVGYPKGWTAICRQDHHCVVSGPV